MLTFTDNIRNSEKMKRDEQVQMVWNTHKSQEVNSTLKWKSSHFKTCPSEGQINPFEELTTHPYLQWSPAHCSPGFWPSKTTEMADTCQKTLFLHQRCYEERKESKLDGVNLIKVHYMHVVHSTMKALCTLSWC
jgi:hypothetical protein